MISYPSLPDGMFFSVRTSAFGAFRIEIRAKRKYFGSRVVETGYFWPGDYSTGERALQLAAESLERTRQLKELDRTKYRTVLELSRKVPK